MSVEVRCDRCGNVIPDADDVAIVGSEHTPYWEMMTYRDIQQEGAKEKRLSMECLAGICWDCETELKDWLSGRKIVTKDASPERG
jgi:hypothetical protein